MNAMGTLQPQLQKNFVAVAQAQVMQNVLFAQFATSKTMERSSNGVSRNSDKFLRRFRRVDETWIH